MKKWFMSMLVLFTVLFGSVMAFNWVKQRLIAKAIQTLPEPEHPVTVLTVTPARWNSTIKAVGFIEPYQGVMVASQLSGTVQHIFFEAGQTVAAGQLLVQLDSAVEQAQLRAAQARLPAADSHYQRYRQLYHQQSLAKAQLEQAQAAYNALVADIESLQATIARRQITAPFAGVIGLNQVQLGQFLPPGTPIVSVQALSAMRVRFTIPQTAIGYLQIKQPVTLQVDAYQQQTFQGVITAIDPVVTPQSGLIQVQADITDSGGLLRSGMLVRATIQLPEQPNQIVLPQTAIAFTLYGESAYILQTDQQGILRVRQITLKVGERQEAVAQVLAGLQPGDRVVTSGQVRLSNGSKVKVVDPALDLQPPALLPRL